MYRNKFITRYLFAFIVPISLLYTTNISAAGERQEGHHQGHNQQRNQTFSHSQQERNQALKRGAGEGNLYHRPMGNTPNVQGNPAQVNQVNVAPQNPLVYPVNPPATPTGPSS